MDIARSEDRVPVLRNYQRLCIRRIKHAYKAGYDAPILQLPTGAGKTVVFADFIRSIDLRVLVLVHRRELIKQTCAKLNEFGVAHGVIAAGFDTNPCDRVQVASVQTLARRKLTHDPELVVIDEAHHARAETWRSILKPLNGALLLGCTATPARLDGKGLGVRSGGLFDTIVSGRTTADLIDAGYLSPVRCFTPARRINTAGLRTKLGDFDNTQLAAVADVADITGDAVDEYRRRADHQPAIAFCVTVKHAEHVAAAFKQAGYRSGCVHGGLSTIERDRLIAGLGTCEIEVLTSCEIISEGLDVPSVGAVILLRPTKSLVLHLQQIGRGMRPTPGKDALVVNDHAGNVMRHGLPDHERVWSLEGIEKQPGEAPVKTCPDCSAIVAASTQVCPNCGHVFWLPKVKTTDGDLFEIGSLEILLALPYSTICKLRLSENQLRAYAEARGYKPGWVWYRMQDQAALQ